MLRKENANNEFINVDIKDVHELIKQNSTIAVFHEKILNEQTKIYLDLETKPDKTTKKLVIIDIAKVKEILANAL